jgi:flagellar basal-body rod modification protein FlgD
MQLFTNTSQSNSSSTANSAISAATSSEASTSDLFTKLLVAQIQNQDPLNPTDSSEFVNQLTQLSQTSALQSLVSQSKSFASAIDSLQAQTLGTQVGNQVAVRTSSVKLGTTAVEGSFTLNSASTATALLLTDASGIKHRVDLGAQSAGEVSFAIDPVKQGLASGNYSLAVETATSETPVTDLHGTLKSVKLSNNGSAVLSVSGIGDVAASQISAFLGKTSG